MKYSHVQLSGSERIVCLPEKYTPDDALLLEGPKLISDLPHPPISKAATFGLEENSSTYQSIQGKLYGKELLFDELHVSWEELLPFLKEGLVVLRAGLTPEKKGYRCQRCNALSPEWFGQFPCSHCGHPCTYCRQCLMMGKVTACSPLFHWNGPPLITSDEQAVLHWKGSFSQGQKEAARILTESMGKNTELLIWAVCGAGKTEILFPGIEKALQNEQRVLIATPRTDVVLELLPRFRKVFPTTAISGLYGKSAEKNLPSQLVIATTHQAMRFTEAFDTVVIDEVDAFPYSIDPSLHHAIQKARKQRATAIYLTATPSPAIYKRVKKGDHPVVKISRRYHGYPLPVPRFQWSGPWKKKLEKRKLPTMVQEWCDQRVNSKTPAFLFVPSVSVLEKTTAILRERYPLIEGVHSEDEDRLAKVTHFRQGNIPLLVTTTILERGVTIPGVDVAVWSAEEDVFSESALVQIAGRAGRSTNRPYGDVVYFHYGKTKAMAAAKQHIVKMNKTPAGKGGTS